MIHLFESVNKQPKDNPKKAMDFRTCYAFVYEKTINEKNIRGIILPFVDKREEFPLPLDIKNKNQHKK